MFETLPNDRVKHSAQLTWKPKSALLTQTVLSLSHRALSAPVFVWGKGENWGFGFYSILKDLRLWFGSYFLGEELKLSGFGFLGHLRLICM